MTALRAIAGWARAAFALDVRSLAAFRIAAGAILLADLATRAGDFGAMYAHDGLAPIEIVRGNHGPGQWSLYLWNESDAWQAGLMIAAATLAALLLVGYRTRIATIGSWILLSSLQMRLPIVVNAGDTMLRVLLFWCMFLPLGCAWSMDARRQTRGAARNAASIGSPDSTVIFSAASIALILQLAIVYWCAGIAKLNDSWLGANALGEILSFRLYGLPAGNWLRQLPDATLWLGRASVALELIGPLLLFIPWRTAMWRIVVVTAFVSFHVGIAATLTVGLFAWVGIAAWLVVLPAAFWGRALRMLRREKMEASGIPPLPSARTTSLRPGDFGSPMLGCSRPFKGGEWRAAAVATAISALMAVVVLWNMVGFVDANRVPRVAAAIRPIGNATALRQSWHMFARPNRYDSWFVYRGRLRNGDVVDLLRGTKLDDDERPTSAQMFANHRWRKLQLRIAQDWNADYRQPLAEYICRRWNETHPRDEQATRLDVYCIRRPIEDRGNSEAFVRLNLAQVILDPTQGNFADALRELEERGEF